VCALLKQLVKLLTMLLFALVQLEQLAIRSPDVIQFLQSLSDKNIEIHAIQVLVELELIAKHTTTLVLVLALKDILEIHTSRVDLSVSRILTVQATRPAVT